MAARADGCPAPASVDLRIANSSALALFRQRVIDPSAVGGAARHPPAGFERADAYGAKGDGVADDTTSLQAALDRARRVWLSPGRVYRITRRLQMGDGTAMSSDGSATLWMAAGAGAFDNRVADRSDRSLYGERGTGLRLSGNDIALSDLFIVKAYQDDAYVIGIDVHESSRVVIRRVRLRGFSLAPGIVTIRSSSDVEVSSSLIHASCSESTNVPSDLPSFQITGIAVDNAQKDSTRVRLLNNVIDGLRIVPRTPRGDQSDGIHFAAIKTGRGSIVAGNDVRGVDEGLDIFGAGIQVRRNRVAARMPLKLIHGAEAIVIADNEFSPTPGGHAIGVFRANPAQPDRQVRDVLIERNRLVMRGSDGAAVHVDATGVYPPTDIVMRQNLVVVARCGRPLFSCTPAQCRVDRNRSVRADRRGAACPD